jgi:hypothetical protein
MGKRSILAALAVLAVALAWHIYSGWGLVTLHVTDAPLGKVLASINRQGGIEIITNLDPSTPVSLDVYRVPPTEALDIVSVRTESSWRAGYLGAPARNAIDAALASFRASKPADGWSAYGTGGFGGVQTQSGQALDLRLVEWKPAGGGGLHELLAEASDKTGVFLAAPADWKPTAKAPKPGPMERAAPDLFRQVGGVSREVFLLRGENRSEASPPPESRWRGGSWIGSTPRGDGPGGSPSGRDPERIAERVEAQITLLPADEQEKARAEAAEMRTFWQSVRDLPEEERGAKAREFFNRPEMAERMEDRRLARDAKMTPTQRIERSRRYWERKVEAKKSGATQ